jgi:hypothetical protein
MATRIGDDARQKIAAAYDDLLDRLAAGEIMAPFYKAAGVSADQVRVWRLEDAAGEREKQWQAARQQSADAYADQVLEVAYNDKLDSGNARVRMDALRWLAAKRNPSYYNDKAQLDVNVRTIDLTRIIGDAQARLAASRVIDGQVIRAALPELESLM